MKLHKIELPPRAPGLSRTLILLHGFGADEHDLLPLAHELDPRLRAVSLQAPLSLGGAMRAWYHLEQTRNGFRFDPDEVRRGSRLAAEAIEEIAQGSPRPLLLGFSQGAGMAMAVALTRPDLCGGLLALSGVPPLVDDGERAPPEKLRGMKAFVAHGTQDPLIPVQVGQATRGLLEGFGLAVTYREYPMGHSVSLDEVDDARAFLRGVL